jgi:hypothetical protein
LSPSFPKAAGCKLTSILERLKCVKTDAPSGCVRMPDYRLYCVDGAGDIGLADWIEAADDEAAIAKAREMKPDAQSYEVWQKNRLVAKLNRYGGLERVPSS